MNIDFSLPDKAHAFNRVVNSSPSSHNFLIQSFHAILWCQIDAFFENLSADAYTFHLDFVEILSSKIEKVSEEKSPGEQKSSSEQIETFIEIQKFMIVRFI